MGENTIENKLITLSNLQTYTSKLNDKFLAKRGHEGSSSASIETSTEKWKTPISAVTLTTTSSGTHTLIKETTSIPEATAQQDGFMTSGHVTTLNDLAARMTTMEAHSASGSTSNDGWKKPISSVTLTADTNGNHVLSGTQGEIPAATSSVDGFMTSTYASKLDGIAEGATKVESSTTNGKIKINGEVTTVYDDSDLVGRVDAIERADHEHISVASKTSGHVTVSTSGKVVTISENDIASNATLTSHTANTTIHITSEERNKWDYLGTSSDGATASTAVGRIKALEEASHTHANKSVLDDITSAKVGAWDSHTADTTIHITADERTKWDNAAERTLGVMDDSTSYLQTSGDKVGVKTSDLGNVNLVKGDNGTWVVSENATAPSGLATAADVAAEIVANEQVVAAALNDHEGRVTSLESLVKLGTAEADDPNSLINNLSDIYRWFSGASESNSGATTLITKVNGIEEGANKYIHPTYTSFGSGLYKISVDGSGHVNGHTAATASDLSTILGGTYVKPSDFTTTVNSSGSDYVTVQIERCYQTTPITVNTNVATEDEINALFN